MAIYPQITALHPEMTAWRRELHAHPETAFEEHRTAQFVADKLHGFGIEVVRGLAGTGVVGVLKGRREGASAVGLRADMDALDIHEQTNRPYASKVPGKMHACGHDGHTTMLLGAAKYLAETRDFAGTAYFIFQPAEENEGGGRVMVEDGLFERFQMDGVYGLHNWPGMPTGRIGVREGPMMAAYDVFEITVTGHGAHGAMPHQGIDPVLISAHVVTGLQTIASRNVDPLASVVVSVTQIHGGDAWNVIPQQVVLRGTVRSFDPQVQELAETNLGRIAKGVAAAHGAEAAIRYERRYPATVNSQAETRHAAHIAAQVVAADNVVNDVTPCMGSEDFAFMLQNKPGSYIWLGAGENHPNLHSPHYDFNDEILPVGASYWAKLVEETLKA
ncbi:MAG TPA: M20 aminoacylase family protein [Aestuariivirgaceae bacterium]|nr:M20 aminoacylase family protein [Aestuariivirgaceae bacterium]